MTELKHDITLTFANERDCALARAMLSCLVVGKDELMKEVSGRPSVETMTLCAEGGWKFTDKILPPSVAVWAAEHLGAVLSRMAHTRAGREKVYAAWHSEQNMLFPSTDGGDFSGSPLATCVLNSYTIHSFLSPKPTESE